MSGIWILDIIWDDLWLQLPLQKETAKRSKQFRATTHLASAIASGDQFTAYAVEEIKASISESESQGNKYDDRMRDDYIPLNRKLMLLCKQKDKWIIAEEDELRSFAVNNVMTKNPRLPDNEWQSVTAEVDIYD